VDAESGPRDQQIRVDLGNFFSDQTILDWFGAVGVWLLVTEGHRTQLQQAVAGRAESPIMSFMPFFK